MLCISQHQTNMSCTHHSPYCTETTNLVHFKHSFLDCTKHILYCTHHSCFSYNIMYMNLKIPSLSPRLPVKSMREGGMVMIWPVSLLPFVRLVLLEREHTNTHYIHLSQSLASSRKCFSTYHERRKNVNKDKIRRRDKIMARLENAKGACGHAYMRVLYSTSERT